MPSGRKELEIVTGRKLRTFPACFKSSNSVFAFLFLVFSLCVSLSLSLRPSLTLSLFVLVFVVCLFFFRFNVVLLCMRPRHCMLWILFGLVSFDISLRLEH